MQKFKGVDVSTRSRGNMRNPVVMPISADDWLKKLAFVGKQTKEMMDELRPFVRCGCMKKLRPHEAYKCLYCGEWYCKECAEEHFGKTVEQHRKEHPIEA
jgi:hypothetical protein